MRLNLTKLLLLLVTVFTLVVGGCKSKPAPLAYDKPLPPGELALRKITDPQDIPDFGGACYNTITLRGAINNSLSYLSKPSSKGFFPYGTITHEQVVASLQAFLGLLDSGLTAQQLNTAIKEKFDVYMSVGCDDRGTVLFTGYYTPIFDGSEVRTERFKYPLYKQPQDLVKQDDGQILGRRVGDGKMVPYPDRAEIERTAMLTGTELVWLSDPFEVYIVHVQGSAKIRMPDGKLVTVGYAANNGYEYTSIREELIKDGKMPSDKISLATIIEYFKEHPSEVAQYTQRNKRYVFFRFEQGPPCGSCNVPVMDMRTIATDKTIYPRACLAFVDANLPRMSAGTDTVSIRPYKGFVLDQDTGGAIRAAGRCDIYMGQGPAAVRVAGQTCQEGRLYYLFLKSPETATPVLTPAK
jgi:membrane-bound lytic murein transglycosylase A